MFKKLVIILAIVVSPLVYGSTVTQTKPNVLGLDYTLPYIFTVGGDSYHKRLPSDLGLSYFRFISNNVGFGLRFATSPDTRNGQNRRFVLSPNVQYQWFQGRTWMPFVRTEIPVLLGGAFNSQGSADQMDIGVITGFGMAWNIGNQMGIPNLLVRYDFNAQYYFGFGNATNQFGIEFFRFGLDYRF